MKQILTLLLLIIRIINVYSQNDCVNKFSVPDELNRGRYKPEGFNYGNPYTMFNKQKPNWNLEKELNNIRSIIISQVGQNDKAYGYAEKYLTIYQNATSTIPHDCNDNQGALCLHPGWTKDNAIVHLVGLKYGHTSTGRDTFIYIPDPLDSWRHSFADKANEGLRNLNPEIVSCWGGDDCDVLKDKAFDLIYYLQAYDLLKTAKYYPGGDEDRNNGDCSARNKLREFSRNYYDEIDRVINSNLGWKKNHGIICGSAMGMAAIVLNDAGVETEWLRGLFGFFSGDGFHIPRPNYSPINWQLRADGSDEHKEDGIENSMFKGSHIWPAKDAPQTNSTGKSGYAEGPDYATYMMSALLPYIRAYTNFLPNNGKYIYDSRYTEIFKWYLNIVDLDGNNPTYDNSAGATNNLGILGLAQWPGGASQAGDYILSMAGETPITESKHYIGDTYINDESGNAILKTNTLKGDKYYFQFLYETGAAVDKRANPLDGGHEDDDFGSFMLSVNGSLLAIDAPYLHSPFQSYTNKLYNHNYAAFSTTKPNFEYPEIKLKSNSNMALSYKQIAKHILADDEELGMVNRNIKLFSTDSNLYYILYDHFSGSSDEDIKMAIHGNGNVSEFSFNRTSNTNTIAYDSYGRVFRWNHPIKNGGKGWGLLSHIALLDAGGLSIAVESNGTEHGAAIRVTDSLGVLHDGDKTSTAYGLHTKLVLTQQTATSIVQTLLFPYQYGDTLPLLSRDETSDYVSTLLRFKTMVDTTSNASQVYINDSTRDFHFGRFSGGPLPITNPFMIPGNSAVFESDAEKAFMSRSDFSLERPGGCSPSIIQFKQAELDEGTNLTYDDTVYIESSAISTVHYKYMGKFKYEGSVYSVTSTSVTFFMPDMQYGYLMQGRRSGKNLTTTHNAYMSYNDSFKYVTITFPAGTTYFTIEVADPCALDCYFPPTAVTIYNTFLFNTGRSEVLGHDLDIVQGAGNLNITNASRMSICPDFVLVNKDSLIMGQECGLERRWLIEEVGTTTELPQDSLNYFCNRTDLLKDREVNKTRNTIIVNDKAGLVLDSGSVTHIGTNSTILIRPGGTLLVKAGATVIIGDSTCEKNRGELLADHGSYICIEEGANMLFLNYIDSVNFYYKDTIDRHIVYIAMPDGMGHNGAIEGKNVLGGRDKFSSEKNGIWAGGSCVSFCDLIKYGVNNRPFGWFNLGLPRALYTSLDTLCINKPFLIDATPSLNETGYWITICKYDTGSKTCIYSIDSIADNGDNCLSNRYLFTPREFGYYRVRLIVHNDCFLTDTFTKIVYVPYLPVAVFTAPDSICSGIGVLHANGALSRSNINKLEYRWTAEPFIDDSTDTSALIGANLASQDWNFDSLASVDSDFTFPGYMFSGGIKYRVSLMVKGWCSDSIFSDTISVPLKVSINLEHAVSYENPIGPTPVRLIGTVLNAQSWSWSPTDYLDSALSLTPVTTPPEPITYVLTGTLNGCSLTDTVVIQYNKMTNAGQDRVVCKNEFTVLGSDFNAVIFLGAYNYVGEGDFVEVYGDFDTERKIFHQYFSTYLIKAYKNFYSSNDMINQLGDSRELREKIYTKKWFNSYYKQFIKYGASQTILDNFKDSLSTDEELQLLVTSKLHWSSENFDQVLSDYVQYFENKGFLNTQIIWEKQDAVSGVWIEEEVWRDYMNISILPASAQKWRMTLIDNDLGLVEYDEVFVGVDSVINPSLDILYQEDSTVYFVDETMPRSTYYSYLWVFGDGDSSTLKNPIHTFPAFDSSYLVCLSVTNACGTYQHCDTLNFDSTGFITGFNKTGSSPDPILSVNTVDKKPKHDLNKGEIMLDNMPNPFNGETIISYAFLPTFTKANLRITDVLGRTIKEIPVHSSEGKVSFDASAQSAGIYYTSLIIDSVVVKSKTMLIDK